MRTFRITTNTTTTLTDVSGHMRWLKLVVTGTPTDWVIQVKNREAPTPKAFYVTDGSGLDASATIQVPFPEGDRPSSSAVKMEGGIDVVTVSGTPAILDVWLEWSKANS